MRARRRHKKTGFTLIELMVVLIILALLLALIVPNVVGKSDDAKQTKARTDVAMIESLLDQYYLDMGEYPSSEQGLQALYKKPDGAEEEKWKGPYSKKRIPDDPWGSPYGYESPGTRTSQPYEVWSLGRDKREGGESYDSDIFSWDDEDAG